MTWKAWTPCRTGSCPGNSFDAAVSVESLHHFTKEEKIPLYDKLRKALKPGGYFILEHPAGYNFAAHPSFVKEKVYGKVHFTFFTAPSNG